MATEITPWPPRWLTEIAPEDLARGDGKEFIEFGEHYCRITKDSVGGRAGQLISMRPWQVQLSSHLLARRPDGRYRHRQALIGVARKNGKSAIGASVALFCLIYGPEGGEVYSIAGDKEQARIVFATAKRMIELDPELTAMFEVYRDSIVLPSTGSVYKVLSAEAYSKEGLNPTCVIFDEIHVQPNRELWDVMALATGSRVEPLIVGITTAGVRTDTSGNDSLCYEMYQYGKKLVSGELFDPSFFFAWWEPRDPTADHRDPDTWREANPGFGDLVSEEDFQGAVLRTPEAEFRTKRCNQWVSSAVTWLKAGSWGELEAAERDIKAGESVVLGFDGSYNGDCTALIACSIPSEGSRPHVQVVKLWEKAKDEATDWKVPILEVEDTIRAACKKWQVLEVACDPYRWARTYQVLEEEGIPILEFPQNVSRMTPATTRFYEAVENGTVSHDGDPALSRHLENCTLKTDQRGSRLAKDHKSSRKFIDAAVAAVMAHDRAYAYEDSESRKAIYNVW